MAIIKSNMLFGVELSRRVDQTSGQDEFRILRSDAEEVVNKLALAYHISLVQPPDLSFQNHVHRLVALDRPPCPYWRPESEARGNAFFDDAVILLNDVV